MLVATQNTPKKVNQHITRGKQFLAKTSTTQPTVRQKG